MSDAELFTDVKTLKEKLLRPLILATLDPYKEYSAIDVLGEVRFDLDLIHKVMVQLAKEDLVIFHSDSLRASKSLRVYRRKLKFSKANRAKINDLENLIIELIKL